MTYDELHRAMDAMVESASHGEGLATRLGTCPWCDNRAIAAAKIGDSVESTCMGCGHHVEVALH